MDQQTGLPVLTRLYLSLDCIGSFFSNLEQLRSLDRARTRVGERLAASRRSEMDAEAAERAHRTEAGLPLDIDEATWPAFRHCYLSAPVDLAEYAECEPTTSWLSRCVLTLQRLAPVGIKALDDGAGETMDEAMNRGAAAWSIEAGAMLHAARESLDVIARALEDPRAWLGGAVKHGEHLGPALRQRAEQVQEVIRRVPLEAVHGTHPAPLPRLGPHDMQAWQLSVGLGMTQQRIAEELNKQHGTRYAQARVSEMLKRAEAHYEACGLAELAPGLSSPRDSAISMDPSLIDMGARKDGAAHHQRARSRQVAHDE
jgi:hypothetical protein